MQLGNEDVMTGIGLMVIISAVALTGAGNSTPYAQPQAIGVLQQSLDRGRDLAQSGRSGATILVTPSQGGTTIELHPGRPTPTSTMDPSANGDVATVQAPVTMTSDAGGSNGGAFAVFISSHGAASAAAWTPSSGTLSQEPTCVSPIAIGIAAGGSQQTLHISCTDASISTSEIR